MKDLLKRSVVLVSVVRSVRSFFGFNSDKLTALFHKKNDPIVRSHYLKDHLVRKLQIGCQGKILSGWLNVDLEPHAKEVVMMDASKKFPFADGSFQYIFTEHMIEHISFDDADFMLHECYRILGDKGKIRISTPNLESLVRVFNDPARQEHADYIDFYYKTFLDRALPRDPVFILNTLFYSYGHRFIHTEMSLHYLLSKAGFKNIKVQVVGESDDLELKNLEMHGADLGQANNELESIVIQAEKHA